MPEQIKAVTFKCSYCGAALLFGAGVEDLVCGYCVSHQQVIRQGDAITLEKFADSLASVGRSADRAAAMAIPRLTKELEMAREQRAFVAAEGEEEIRKIQGRAGRLFANSALVPLVTGLIIGGGVMRVDGAKLLPALLVLVALGLAAGACAHFFLRARNAAELAQVRRELNKALISLDSQIAVLEQSLRRNLEAYR